MLNRMLLAIVLAGMAGSISAAAQDAQQSNERAGDAGQDGSKSQDADQAKSKVGLLGGPAVTDNDTSQPDPRFGGGVDRRTTIPFDRWLRVMNGVSLSIDQQAEIETIVNAFRQSQRRFNEEYGLEQRRLQQEARRLRQEGRDAPRELTQRIQEIRRAAPQAQYCQEQVWNVLTMSQQDKARAELALVREQIARRQQQQQQRRRAMDAMRGDGEAMDAMQEDGMMRSGDDRADAAGRSAESFDWENSGLDAASLRRLAFLLRHQRNAEVRADSGGE